MAKLFSARTLALGALAAAAAYAVSKRSGPAASTVSAPAPYVPPAPAPAPMPANADVAGPPENTATAVPAPDPVVHAPEGGIDETAEVEAAAAEAANIGGPAPEYPDPEDESVAAGEAAVPLEEAGEGSSEGEELAEADLTENVADPVEAERQVDAVIVAQENPAAGEATPDLPPPPTAPPVGAAPPEPAPPADDKSTAVWQNEDQPTVEAPAVSDEADKK